MNGAIYFGVAGSGPGAGKDTFADTLMHYLLALGVPAKVVGFADPIRSIARDLGLDLSRDKKEVPQYLALSHHQIISKFQEHFGRIIGEALVAAVQRELGFLSEARVSPRRFMQVLGTEGGREVSPDFWVKRLKEAYRPGHQRVYIISDVRFENEADALSAVAPGTTWDGWKALAFVHRAVTVTTKHISESSQQELISRSRWFVPNVQTSELAFRHRLLSAWCPEIAKTLGVGP